MKTILIVILVISTGAVTANAVAAQTPTPSGEQTATPTPESSPTPGATTEPSATETVPAGNMFVTARLPVPAGTQVTFDYLDVEAGVLIVCATATTTAADEEGLSRISATLPPECSLGISICPRSQAHGESGCVRISVNDDVYGWFNFVADGSLDLGTLSVVPIEIPHPPETGSGEVPPTLVPAIIAPRTGHGTSSASGSTGALLAAAFAAGGILAISGSALITVQRRRC